MSTDSDVTSTASPQVVEDTNISEQPRTSFHLDRTLSSTVEDFGRRTSHSLPQSYTSMAQIPNTISVAVDPVALITTECITVTSAMRKHARWAHSSVSSILGGGSSPGLQNSRPGTPREDALSVRKGQKGRPSIGPLGADEDGGLANRWGLRGKKGKSMQDNPLMAGFGRLRRELAGCKGRRRIPSWVGIHGDCTDARDRYT